MRSKTKDTLIELEKALKDYNETFENLVATTLSSSVIEDNNRKDYTGVVIKARECHELLENLRHTSIQRFESASSTSHLVNIISVMLAIVFSAVASGIISDKILRRINYVTG